MKTLIAAVALLLASCNNNDISGPSQTWDVWLNHGQPDSCHGALSLDSAASGSWVCGSNHGAARGRLSPEVALDLDAAPRHILITGILREYDSAIIATTDDARPFVGYLVP